MSERDGRAQTDAMERFKEAVLLRSRLHRERGAAKDTRGEATVDAALRVVSKQVGPFNEWGA
jgi:hypothetical protein